MKIFVLITSLYLCSSAGAQNIRRMSASLYWYSSGAASLLDGNVTVFDDQYSNAVDQYDVLKISNFGENLGIFRNGKILAIEARKWTFVNDTINYRIWNLQPRQYVLFFLPERLDTAILSMSLYDSYLGTTTAISRTDTSQIIFSVNAVPASYAFNRFKLILKKQVQTWPVNFISISAARQDSRVEITWSAAGDTRYYVIEHSADSRHFAPVDSVQSTTHSTLTARYAFVHYLSDPGNHFYRIQAIDWNGHFTYSSIVTLPPKGYWPGIKVLNPIENKWLELQFANQPEGRYHVQLINQLGIAVSNVRIFNSGGHNLHSMRLPALPPAVYTLNIFYNDDRVFAAKVMVK